MRGRVWRYGDHVNTDVIIPGRYLDDYDVKNMARHALEDLDASFAKEVSYGDIIVAGRNFGCGSSREQAPLALKGAGVGAVVAVSFARIFFRNAVNVGLPVIECDATGMFEKGDVALINLEKGILVNETSGATAKFEPLPGFLLEILKEGGLVAHTAKRFR
ncbi:MAG: Isopropylmalate/citramalate isomerase small subunit [Methanomassiliicoccales archaeon PtaB.Bin134]|jgi:3-isopropylmalate dehydratase small subunit|nr:MAG: Isopropylmalate/citramalate isomerase small subunit [Methanomassiliicoccales archaeon PtaB.Bin134]